MEKHGGWLLRYTQEKQCRASKRKDKRSQLRANPYAEFAKICGENETSLCEIVKKGKEIRAGLAVTLQAANVTTTVCDKCFFCKMEKVFRYRVYRLWYHSVGSDICRGCWDITPVRKAEGSYCTP